MFCTLDNCIENPLNFARILLKGYQYGYFNSQGQLILGDLNYQKETNWRTLRMSPSYVLTKNHIGNCIDVGLLLHNKIPQIMPLLRYSQQDSMRAVHVYPFYRYNNKFHYVIVNDDIKESHEYNSCNDFFQRRFLNDSSIYFYDYYVMTNIPLTPSLYTWGEFIDFVINNNPCYRVYRKF